MPKINQEEYKFLKNIDDNWEWIARDDSKSLFIFVEKPHKKNGMKYWDVSNYTAELVGSIKSDLFQFIQWEDDEPYSIQGLINEYLDDEYGYFNMNLSREFEEFIKKESEETEMKGIKNVIEFIESDINLIEEKLPKMNREKSEGRKEWHEGYLTAMKEVQNKLGQLDEPEVLSQEWIDENTYYVHDRESSMVYAIDLQNLLVPKQKKVKVDKEDAENIKDYKEEGWRLSHLINDTGADANHDELLAKAWLAYPNIEVEAEQKYIVSDNSSIPLLIKNDSGEIMSYDSQIAYNNSNGTIELTEQEIRSYDERYMTFAKPVEEIEK